ncbi:CorA family divalent cation transporter [Peredibacter starrii]|uniref:CorA family divalent cation transporter n=1 Tax=Peredibacter starrii TaxID=28202 RepID=A0AAX4HPR6_9BACT|nr:CorA family divalent cation transporter [Peredibacter starrii]WPU65112.1 CorA family divalent cation transporter [Peredibacter starrii]
MITENLLTNRSFSWFDVQEPHSDDFERLNTEFNLPYLLVQDTLRPEHLPKYEFTEEGHFLMMRSFDQECGDEVTTVQDMTRKIALYITENHLLTIHRVPLPYLSKVIEKCKKADQPKTIQGLVHQVVLGTIRSYEDPINNLQNLYDEFESDVLSKKLGLDTSRIYFFRRQLFVIKRILKQTNDALYHSKDFWEENHSMLQDLKENIDQLYFQLDEISDNFEHLFELHIAMNDQRANEVMKVLTVFSTILLPLNFLASFYGMNFTQIPGLESKHALNLVITAMILICVGGIWFFRYKGWFKTSRE